MSNFQQCVLNLIQTPKTAVTISSATIGTGVSTVMEVLPQSFGEVASLVGIILSVVLIYVHLRKSGIETRESEVKIAILKLKKKAIERGLQLRRTEDDDLFDEVVTK